MVFHVGFTNDTENRCNIWFCFALCKQHKLEHLKNDRLLVQVLLLLVFKDKDWMMKNSNDWNKKWKRDSIELYWGTSLQVETDIPSVVTNMSNVRLNNESLMLSIELKSWIGFTCCYGLSAYSTQWIKSNDCNLNLPDWSIEHLTTSVIGLVFFQMYGSFTKLLRLTFTMHSF